MLDQRSLRWTSGCLVDLGRSDVSTEQVCQVTCNENAMQDVKSWTASVESKACSNSEAGQFVNTIYF